MKHKRLWMVLAAVALLAVAILVYILQQNKFYKTPPPASNDKSAKAPVPRFDHIVVIVMENKDYGSIIGSPDAPYLNQLARDNALATNYYANFHPSLPNYIAMTSGTNATITDDCSPPGGSFISEQSYMKLVWNVNLIYFFNQLAIAALYGSRAD